MLQKGERERLEERTTVQDIGERDNTIEDLHCTCCSHLISNHTHTLTLSLYTFSNTPEAALHPA